MRVWIALRRVSPPPDEGEVGPKDRVEGTMRNVRSRDHARQLRKNMTDAERALWARLRKRLVRGCQFRRQLPIGPYIVDFVCLEKRLIIELDGGQ